MNVPVSTEFPKYYAGAIETASRDEIRHHQEKKLRPLVDWMYERCPFWTNMFNEIGAKDKTLKIYDDPQLGGTIHCSHDYWAHNVPFMLDWLDERTK